MFGFSPFASQAFGGVPAADGSVAVSSNFDMAYSVAAFVSRNLDVAYQVESGALTQVSRNFDLAYSTSAFVSLELALAYGVQAHVSTDLNISYQVVAETNFVRAPTGGGYSPHRAGRSNRPRDIQGTCR